MMLINLISTDHFRNRYRFFSINDLQPDFFNSHVIEVSWGRIGHSGKKVTKLFSNQRKMEQEVARLVKLRKNHGYHSMPLD